MIGVCNWNFCWIRFSSRVSLLSILWFRTTGNGAASILGEIRPVYRTDSHSAPRELLLLLICGHYSRKETRRRLEFSFKTIPIFTEGSFTFVFGNVDLKSTDRPCLYCQIVHRTSPPVHKYSARYSSRLVSVCHIYLTDTLICTLVSLNDTGNLFIFPIRLAITLVNITCE